MIDAECQEPLYHQCFAQLLCWPLDQRATGNGRMLKKKFQMDHSNQYHIYSIKLAGSNFYSAPFYLSLTSLKIS
jgi:hypothetical protein